MVKHGTSAESRSSLALILSRPLALLVFSVLSSCNTRCVNFPEIKGRGEVKVVTVSSGLIESLILLANVDPVDEK